MWPTPKGTDADRGGRGDLIQAVRGNQSPSGHFRSPSEASSPESEDSTLDSNEQECALCGSASRTPSAGGSLPGTGPGSRAIPTCAPLWPTPVAHDDGKTFEAHMAMKARMKGGPRQVPTSLAVVAKATERGQWCPCRCHTSTSSAAGSPARTSASPAAGPDWPENARVFGGSSQGSLGNYDPATSSLRTSQLSLLEGSTSSLRTLPRAGSMRNGTIFRRRPLAPLTAATGSGSLPTPEASNTKARALRTNGREPRDFLKPIWATPTKSDGTGGPGNSGRDGGENLRTQVARIEREKLTSDGLWTTPSADDTGHRKGKYAQGGTALSAQAGGSLNPAWVEWLMNFPAGWTAAGGTGSPTSPESPSESPSESTDCER